MIKRMVLLAALVSLLPCLAMAGTLSWTTTGTFGSTLTNTSGNYPLVFTGASCSSPPAGACDGFVQFGSFKLGSCATAKCNGGDTLTLHIEQFLPNSGGKDLEATLSGTVFKRGKSTLVIDFSKIVVSIGSVVYSLPAKHLTLNGTNVNGGVTTLQGNISVAEPNARLLLGLGTVGLMALTLVSRKMITS